jgi:hypothetical protein
MHRVEGERAAGVTLAAISNWSGLHVDAISRHWHNHVPAERKAQYLVDVPLDQLVKRATAERTSLIDYLAVLRKQLFDLFLAASGAGDAYRAATLAGRIKEVLQMMGAMTGEVEALARTTVVNNTPVILNSPVFGELQAMLISRLKQYPDALASVVAGLRELEQRAGGDAPQSPPMIELRAREGVSHAA